MAARTRMIDDLPAPPADKTGWPWTDTGIDSVPPDQAWPSFSIITPSYNQGQFLEETIRSILLQGIPNLEVIVMDGGSQDQSREILEKYGPWLTHWVSEPDKGQSHAINKGWERATGDWMAYLNSDDMYFPGALKAVAMATQHDPSIAALAGGVRFVDADTRLRKNKYPFLRLDPAERRRDAHLRDADRAEPAADDVLVYAPFDLSILPPSSWFMPQQGTFFSRRHMDTIGRRLENDLHFTMDRELMYRLCRSGKTVLLPNRILSGDRNHGDTKRQSHALRMYREDALALSYCTWGDRKDARLRKRVARLRRAQGHYIFANQATSSVSALYHYGLAAWGRPGYLLKSGFARRVLQRLNPWS